MDRNSQLYNVDCSSGMLPVLTSESRMWVSRLESEVSILKKKLLIFYNIDIGE